MAGRGGELDSLLSRLGSPDQAERWRAQTELRQSEPFPIDLLMPRLIRLARIRRQAPFLIVTGILTSGLLLLGLLLVFDRLFGRASHVPVLLAGLVGIGLMAWRWKRLRGVAARALHQFNDVRQVPALIAALSDDGHERRVVARELLLHLLLRLRPDPTAPPDATLQTSLCSLLDIEAPPLVLAALKALAATNDGSALERVQRLTAEGTPDVRKAAEECAQEIVAQRMRKRVQHDLLPIVQDR
jgi:hypothetical protein